MTDCKRMES